MGDLTVCPVSTAASADADSAGVARAAVAGAEATGGATDTGAAITTGAPTGPLTMRTLPSASVISSSETLDSDTKSIRVLSFLKSMDLAVFCC